jgi:hypothetical protein
LRQKSFPSEMIGKQAQQMCGPIGQKHKAKSVYCSDCQLGSQQMIVTLQ